MPQLARLPTVVHLHALRAAQVAFPRQIPDPARGAHSLDELAVDDVRAGRAQRGRDNADVLHGGDSKALALCLIFGNDETELLVEKLSGS